MNYMILRSKSYIGAETPLNIGGNFHGIRKDAADITASWVENHENGETTQKRTASDMKEDPHAQDNDSQNKKTAVTQEENETGRQENTTR
jgi:hypothetical protein